MPAAPASNASLPSPVSVAPHASHGAGIKLVAALVLLLSLSLAIAFWQNQQRVPKRLHEAAVASHSAALFDGMQNQLQLAERLLHALELIAPLRAAGDHDAFERLAKTLGPSFSDLHPLALAQVVSGEGAPATRFFRVGTLLDISPTAAERQWKAMSPEMSRLALEAARRAHASGRLSVAGPLQLAGHRLLAIAQPARGGTAHAVLLDLDQWLASALGLHAEWLDASLALDEPATDANLSRYRFTSVTPPLELLIKPRPLAPASPAIIVGSAGIALFGAVVSALILLLGLRGNKAAINARRASQALSESDERLQRTLQLTQDGIWEYDLRRRTLYISPQALQLIGWSAERAAVLVAGSRASTAPTPFSVLHMLPRQWRREVLRTILDSAAATTAKALELKFPVSDTLLASRWLRLRVRRTSDARGQPMMIAGSLVDISEEITHASAQDRYRALMMRVLDAMPIPVAVKSADQKVVMLNERYATQLMTTLENEARRFSDGAEGRTAATDNGFAERMEEIDHLAIATGEPQVTHEWIRTAEGEELYLRITRVLCDGLNGEPMVLGTYEDLTELQRQAQQQSALRAYFEKIFDSLPTPTYIKDANHRYILTNQAHARANKTTKENVLGRRAADFSPDEAEEIEAAERYLLEQGSEEIHEKEYVLNSGNMQRNTIIRKVRITDPAGNAVLIGTSSNVTVLREVEADLRQQAEQQSRLRHFLQDVFDAVPHPLFVKDRQHRYIMTNRAHSESVGASMEDILGKRSADFVSEATARVIEESEEQLFAGQTSPELIESEYVLPHLGGQTRHTIIRKALCLSVDGQSVLVGVNTDITRLREAEAGLRRHRDQLSELVREQTIDLVRAKEVAERANETKSSFLANMSHELRTPLHAILSFARLGEARGEHLAPEKLHDYFNRIRISGDRLLAMLNDLLDLAKLEAGRVMLDVRATRIENTVLESTREFEAWLAARRQRLDIIAEPDLPRIMVDAIKIGQVLRNLLSNAIKFSPDDSCITLHIRACQLPSKSGKVPGVEISVADQGQGIPEEELESVFGKFVQSSSNRDDAAGTGLGLAISREIVSAHGGEIFARNRPEVGAEFVVRLRVDRRSPRPEGAAAPTMDANGRSAEETAKDAAAPQGAAVRITT